MLLIYAPIFMTEQTNRNQKEGLTIPKTKIRLSHFRFNDVAFDSSGLLCVVGIIFVPMKLYLIFIS